MHIIFLSFLSIFFYAFLNTTFSQEKDTIQLVREFAPKSEELLDFYRFEGIDYIKIKAKGKSLADKNILIISREYWNKKVTKVDTCLNTSKMGMKAGTNELSISVMSKREDKDSIKFVFFFPRFYATKFFKALKGGNYSLRDPFNGKEQSYSAKEQIMLLVHSLPYQDPKQPGFSSYCELSSKGVPPSQWGEKYGVEHYITFEIQFE
jgi:hypothetical protein